MPTRRLADQKTKSGGIFIREIDGSQFNLNLMALLVTQNRGKPSHHTMLTGIGHQNPQINAGPIEPAVQRLALNRRFGAHLNQIRKCCIRGENPAIEVGAHDGLWRLFGDSRQRRAMLGVNRGPRRHRRVAQKRRNTHQCKRKPIFPKRRRGDEESGTVKTMDPRLIGSTTHSDSSQ